MSASSIQWKNYSAVLMHPIFDRQYRYVIRSMQSITKICMPYLEEKTNVEGQIDGNKERY